MILTVVKETSSPSLRSTELWVYKTKQNKNLAGCVCPKSEWIETPKEAPAAKGNPGQVLLSFFTGLFRTTLGVSSFLFWYFTLIHNKKHIVLMNYIPENMAGAYKGTGQRTLFLTLFPCELISQMKALQLFGVIFLSFSWPGHKGKSCLICVNKNASQGMRSKRGEWGSGWSWATGNKWKILMQFLLNQWSPRRPPIHDALTTLVHAEGNGSFSFLMCCGCTAQGERNPPSTAEGHVKTNFWFWSWDHLSQWWGMQKALWSLLIKHSCSP